MNDGGSGLTSGATVISTVLIVVVLIIAYFLREKIKEDKKNEDPKPDEIWLRDLKKMKMEEEKNDGNKEG